MSNRNEKTDLMSEKILLSKSPQSAVVMAVIVHMAALITMLGWLLATASFGTLAWPGGSDTAKNAVGILVMLLLLALSLGIVSVFIYKLDDTHYGLQGALRWAVVGVVYILMSRITSLLLPLNPFARNVLQLALVSLAYGLVFRLVPIAKNDLEK